MATTIYGCVDTEGNIVFGLSSVSCLAQSACLITSGDHAGQVSLTLTEAAYNEECNDTFYACVNPTTGKFIALIPDDCCSACNTYSPWDSSITYPIGWKVLYTGVCYESLQNANLNHQPSTSPTWWGSIPCSCPAEYGDDSELCCFGAGKTPKYLCITFSGLKRCSDDSTIGGFAVCCRQREGCSDGTEPNACWEGTTVIDGDNCLVLIDWTGHYSQSGIQICSATKKYYSGGSANYCAGPANGMIKSYCGNDQNVVTSCCDGSIEGNHTVAAYGGGCTVYDQITNKRIEAC